MEVFFVRHGETTGNKAHQYQTPATPLTERGRRQASAVALRLRTLNPTRIIASPFTRAHETAKIIGQELGLPVTTHESLVELRRPTYMHGRSHFSLKSFWYITKWYFTFNDSSWRQYEAESYEMFVERIQEAREYLEHFGDHERIVVVSHSIFINFFIEHVCNQRHMNLFEAMITISKIKALNNSSLSCLKFTPSENKSLCTWITQSFDDDSHVVT